MSSHNDNIFLQLLATNDLPLATSSKNLLATVAEIPYLNRG